MADVPSNAIGYLPKKNAVLQTQIKLGLTKDPKLLVKIMDFEWDRIETYKLSLMHFANANMYLHS